MRCNEPLLFSTIVGNEKMNSMNSPGASCPFCNREELSDIIAQDGPLLLLKNKYPVLQDTFQTVLIETHDCSSELSLYSKEHLYRVIRFGVKNWLAMEKSGEFNSVIFFKNHGPFSGGTLEHPHMQIIGLKNFDYKKNVLPENFQGIAINRGPGSEFNLSTMPRIGFYEFNAILYDMDHINRLADYIQAAAHYIMHHYNRRCSSYNIFFYHFNDAIKVKIVPRFITSPLFVGYSIPQITDSMEKIVKDVQEKYFPDNTEGGRHD